MRPCLPGSPCQTAEVFASIRCDGTVLADYFADLFVNDCLVIELKACKTLSNEHITQVIGYLRASNQRHAL